MRQYELLLCELKNLRAEVKRQRGKIADLNSAIRQAVGLLEQCEHDMAFSVLMRLFEQLPKQDTDAHAEPCDQ
jgi:hypothetical protein